MARAQMGLEEAEEAGKEIKASTVFLPGGIFRQEKPNNSKLSLNFWKLQMSAQFFKVKSTCEVPSSQAHAAQEP